MKKNVLLKSCFKVPIYEAYVWVIVAIDPEKSLKRMAKRFGYTPDKVEFDAICVRENGEVGLFFEAGILSESTVAHEITHAVEAVMQFIGNECSKCDEPRSYLNGYITKRIRAVLKKNKIKILKG